MGSCLALARSSGLGARPAVSLELDLREWARWLSQGCQVTAGYPSESPTEHIALPYKTCGTAEEQYEDFMSSRAADERTGQRMELWVRQLYEPMRTAVRVQWVDMPDESRWPNLSLDEWQERRARRVARLWSEQCGQHRVLSRDQYDAAYSLAYDLLGDFYRRWARGV
jgi:hypothetical protein